VWYRGDRFQGWQSQRTGTSVQETLESALATLGVAGRPMAAGRTDRGVHARCQPVSVRVPGEVEPEALLALRGEGWGIAAAARAPDGSVFAAVRVVCPRTAPESAGFNPASSLFVQSLRKD